MENNPVVVIATHERVEITCINVNLLLRQGATVVLVVSKIEEIPIYVERFKSYHPSSAFVHIIHADNSPLGAKWQFGVDYARKLDPSHLIINGSDDILSKNFVKTACENNYHAFGLQQWYILNPTTKELHLFSYLSPQPLGGGRCYNRKFLDDIDFKLFNTGAAKWLDDQGWHCTRGYDVLQYYGHDAMSILAVKGDWPVMNPLDKTFGHKNAEHLRTFTGKDVDTILKHTFDYEM